MNLRGPDTLFRYLLKLLADNYLADQPYIQEQRLTELDK